MNTIVDIFIKFFSLGCVSFGGPAAHIGYFQQAFVDKHKWLDVPTYARIVALSQFLPGPGSSQVGFAIGHHRAGLAGAVTAFVAFTLPSVILMLVLALIGFQYAETITFQGVIYGLKLLAVVVVADAIITMGKTFCQQWQYKVIAIISALILVFSPSSLMQLAVISLSALAGFLLFNKLNGLAETDQEASTAGSGINWFALLLFVVLFTIALGVNDSMPLVKWFGEFYYAGSLVFGGGHVVLPLLQETVASGMSEDAFLTGYAAAQAVPGPMFTMATYLGSQLDASSPILTALVATVAIFLPGFLLLLAFQKAWHKFSTMPQVSAAMSAINAAVVGLLIAAFYQPIASAAIHSNLDLVAVVIGFGLLRFVKVPIWLLVACYAGIGVLFFQL